MALTLKNRFVMRHISPSRLSFNVTLTHVLRSKSTPKIRFFDENCEENLKLFDIYSLRRWISDEWGACSKVCGGGIRERLVVCAEENNGARHRVPDEACGSNRPKIQEPCNTHECPKWQVNDWSGVSVSFSLLGLFKG